MLKPEFAPRDVPGRIAVTLAALSATVLLTCIPLPGLDSAKLWSSGATRIWSSLSIGAISVTPIVTALCLAQLAWLLGPRRWNQADTAGTLPRWVQWLALVLAIVQSGGIATAMEGVPGLVVEPGTAFRASCVFTLTASTFLIWWLADAMTRYGLGSGLWLLLAVPFFVQVAHAAGTAYEAAAMGQVAASALAVIVAYLAASAAAVTVVVMTEPGPERGEGMLWPLLLSMTALDLIALPVAALMGQSGLEVLIGPYRMVHVAGLLFVFVHLWNWRRAAEPVSRSRVLLRFAVLAAIVLAGEQLKIAGLDFGISAQLLIIATLVAVNILCRNEPATLA